jgi:hypothetical protein
MTRLEVELILPLLLDDAQVRPQRCLGDRLDVFPPMPNPTM